MVFFIVSAWLSAASIFYEFNQQRGPSILEWTKKNLWKTVFKKFEVIWSAQANHITSDFLKAVFHKF